LASENFEICCRKKRKADHTKEITEPNMTLDLLSWKTRSRVKTDLITDLIKLITHLTRKEM